MFDQQITTSGNMAKSSAPSAPGIDAETVAVDMAVLLSFEELQEDNEPDLLVELMELYLQDAPVKIDAIREAVARADKEALKRAAHSLKGSSGTLGVRQLASVCEELECLANAASSDATALTHRLEEEFVRVQEVLLSELHLRRFSA